MKLRSHAILNLFLTLLLFSCKKEDVEDSLSSATWKSDNKSVAVEALEVSRGKLITRVVGSGIIKGAQEAWSISENSGIIEEVYVSPGSFVNKGDALLKIESNLAYWDMVKAEKQYEMSTLEYNGAEKSYGNGWITEVEYKRIISEWHNRRLLLEQAKKAFNDTTLKAPITGYVSLMDTTLTKGNYLGRNVKVLKVIDRERYILEIYPGQREIGLIDKSSPVSVYVDLSDRILQMSGSVLDISGGSDENTGSFPVRIIWDNIWNDQVLPGMTARVEVDTTGAVEGVVIPFDKVIEREGEQWVFLFKSGETGGSGVVEARRVTLGARLGNRVMVKDGIKEGETLIVSGFASLSPGRNVTITIIGDTGGL